MDTQMWRAGQRNTDSRSEVAASAADDVASRAEADATTAETASISQWITMYATITQLFKLLVTTIDPLQA